MKLWMDNQLTMNYSSPKFSIPKTERFKLYSIYWPDKTQQIKRAGRQELQVHVDAMKVSRMIDQEERLARGQRKSKRQFKTNVSPIRTHRSAHVSPTSLRNMVQPSNSRIVERLFVKCPKGKSPLIRDKFGFLNMLKINCVQLRTLKNQFMNKMDFRALSGQIFLGPKISILDLAATASNGTLKGTTNRQQEDDHNLLY